MGASSILSKKTTARPGLGKAASVNLIMLIYFVSGACSLIDQVVWVRLLKLTLGNTVYATSIVVSVFMGGLALGALIMGRYCDFVTRRLRLYALLETLVTISALSLPWALRLADNVYVWFYRVYHPAHWQLLAVQIAISAVILLVPTVLMGSTLPLLGRFVTALEAEAGHLVGRLYALNTLGAAAGTFLAGFFMIRMFGVMGTLYAAASLNLIVAAGGWLLSVFSSAATADVPEPTAPRPQPVHDAAHADRKFCLLIAALFASGLICIGYELVWMRSIIHLLGGSTYVFSAVLTVYLVGNVIGAGIGSGLVKQIKAPAVAFGVTLFMLAAYGIGYIPLLSFWTDKGLSYVNNQVEFINWLIPFSMFVVKPIVHSVFLFLVPCTIMGVGFVFALQAWANHVHLVGRSTAAAYGANTIGAVAGGLVTGFVLVPLLGVQLSVSILGLIGLWIAVLLWISFAAHLCPLPRFSAVGFGLVGTLVVVMLPGGMFGNVVAASPANPALKLEYVQEGLTTTVSLHRNRSEGTLYMYSSGQSIAGENQSARGDQKMLGHLSVLLGGDTESVLSVGFGCGETTACLAMHDLERIDCVEIAPEVVYVALKYFRHLNLGDRLDEEVNMIYMDAKNYIHLTDRKYDVIINDSIHPRLFAENASLYTSEYYDAAKEHLNDGGIVVCWIPTYAMPVRIAQSLIGTFLEAFPHVSLWYLVPHPAPLMLLIGSEDEQYFSPRRIEDAFLNERVRKSLLEINVTNSMDILGCYIADKSDMEQYFADFPVNSDYHPFVEFATDNEELYSHCAIYDYFVWRMRSDSLGRHIDWTGFTEDQRTAWLEEYRRAYERQLEDCEVASSQSDRLDVDD